jgi:hypothetical protein
MCTLVTDVTAVAYGYHAYQFLHICYGYAKAGEVLHSV